MYKLKTSIINILLLCMLLISFNFNFIFTCDNKKISMYHIKNIDEEKKSSFIDSYSKDIEKYEETDKIIYYNNDKDFFNFFNNMRKKSEYPEDYQVLLIIKKSKMQRKRIE